MHNTLISTAGTTNRSKSPTDIVPVEIDFAAWLSSLPKLVALPAEVITTAVWAADGGVTVINPQKTDTLVWAQLNGGTIGATATIKCTVTTSAGNIGTFAYVCKID